MTTTKTTETTEPITIRFAAHTIRQTTHGERTFKNAAALGKWVAQQAARDREIEILAYGA